MDSEILRNRGSQTARNGFANENQIAIKFNNWQDDNEAKEWLKIMGYNLDKIEKVIAIKLHGFKTDVQVKITIFLKDAISAENLSIKLVSNLTGFNQIDKRWVDKYSELWNMSEEIINILKYFVGEIRSERKDLRDLRRMFFSEMTEKEQDAIMRFFNENKILIVSDLLRGRGDFSAGWMLVAQKLTDESRWTLKNINEVMNHFGNGEIRFTKDGNLKIGKIGMQRKGGDNGRKTAQMLQFKINPAELFNLK
jgi:R.HinP1I restriction endonuclease